MFVYEIVNDDIGKDRIILKCSHYRKMKHDIPIRNFMGKILPCDIEKQIYKRGEIYQVESQEQLQKRSKTQRGRHDY